MGSKLRKTEPSLDDPRRRPVDEEYQLIRQRCGHPQLAIIDLNQALADGRVRSMRRHTGSGKRERLLPEVWAHRDLAIELVGSFAVALSRRRPPVQVDGLVFFLWHPDVEKVWPAPRQVDDEMAPVRAKPGTKPTGDWYTLIAQWLIAVAADDPKRLLNVDALVVEATAFLEKEISWAPSNPKDLRKKIVELLILVPR